MPVVPAALAAGRVALMAGRVLPAIGRVGSKVVEAFGGFFRAGMKLMRGAEKSGKALYRAIDFQGFGDQDAGPDDRGKPQPELVRREDGFWKGALTGAAVAGGVALAVSELGDNSPVPERAAAPEAAIATQVPPAAEASDERPPVDATQPIPAAAEPVAVRSGIERMDVIPTPSTGPPTGWGNYVPDPASSPMDVQRPATTAGEQLQAAQLDGSGPSSPDARRTQTAAATSATPAMAA